MTQQGNYNVGKKAYFKEYRQRDYVKAKIRAYRSTDEYKAMHKVSNKKYAETHKEQIKAKNDRWNNSKAAKESKSNYRSKHRKLLMTEFDIVRFAKNMYRHRAEITRKRKDSWVTGDELISKEAFIEFCKDNKDEIRELWENWKANNYNRQLSPSLDRIDNNKGYVAGNLQFLTLRANQQKYWSGI